MNYKQYTLSSITKVSTFYDHTFSFTLSLTGTLCDLTTNESRNSFCIKFTSLAAVNMFGKATYRDSLLLEAILPPINDMNNPFRITNNALTPFHRIDDGILIKSIQIHQYSLNKTLLLNATKLSKSPKNSVFGTVRPSSRATNTHICGQILMVLPYDEIRKNQVLYIFDGNDIAELCLWEATSSNNTPFKPRQGTFIYLYGVVKLYRSSVNYASRSGTSVIYQFPSSQFPTSLSSDTIKSLDAHIHYIKERAQKYLTIPYFHSKAMPLTSTNPHYIGFKNGIAFNQFSRPQQYLKSPDNPISMFKGFEISVPTHPLLWISGPEQQNSLAIVAYVVTFTYNSIDITFNYPKLKIATDPCGLRIPVIEGSENNTYRIETSASAPLTKSIGELLGEAVKRKELVLFKNISLINSDNPRLFWKSSPSLRIIHPGFSVCYLTLFCEYIHYLSKTLQLESSGSSSFVNLPSSLFTYPLLSLNHTQPLPYVRTSIMTIPEQRLSPPSLSIISVLDPVFSNAEFWVCFHARDATGHALFITTIKVLESLYHPFGILIKDQNTIIPSLPNIISHSQLFNSDSLQINLCFALFKYYNEPILVPEIENMVKSY